MKMWKFAAIAALLGACSSEPEGQEWPIVEFAPTPDAGMHAALEDMPTEDEPDIAPEPEPKAMGEACTADAECAGGVCMTGEGFQDGYCTSYDCEACGEGSQCARRRNEPGYCAPDCTSDYDCREGYSCRYEFRRNDPNPPRLCTPTFGAADGEACNSGWECQGFNCEGWAGGYCSSYCLTTDDCSTLREFDNVCVNTGLGYSQCLRSCTSGDDCRDGYLCEDLGGGESVCVEDPTREFDDAIFTDNPVGIECGLTPENGVLNLEYEIAADTTSYLITPMTRDGAPLAPRRILLPDGTEKNFNAERAIFTYPAEFLGSMNPTLVPQAPVFEDMFATGVQQYVLETEAPEVCYYLLEQSEPGTALDMNVYLVGIGGVTAANAAADPNFTTLFDEVARIYAQMGIELRDVRYYDVAPDVATEFGVVRNVGDLPDLLRQSVVPANDLQSALSVNVFFASEFAAGGTIGVSYGLPGPAGLHGTHGSGVVFTAEYMGRQVEDALGTSTDGNEYTALLLAHEVGHWLGLFHTTEKYGGPPDPLDDTPSCQRAEYADGCPDWGNFMFPYAGAGNTDATADQGYTMRMNPITQVSNGGTP